MIVEPIPDATADVIDDSGAVGDTTERDVINLDQTTSDSTVTDTSVETDDGGTVTKGGGCSAGGANGTGAAGFALLFLMLAALAVSRRAFAR